MRTTTARGYGYTHQRLRRQWEPLVATGNVQCHAEICLMPDRWIDPDERWHLGHTPDRSRYTGPEHELCNTSEGGRRGHISREWWTSRDW